MRPEDLDERIRMFAGMDREPSEPVVPEPEPAEPPRAAPLRLMDELDSYLPPRG